jgi:hypothetical protein
MLNGSYKLEIESCEKDWGWGCDNQKTQSTNIDEMLAQIKERILKMDNGDVVEELCISVLTISKLGSDVEF